MADGFAQILPPESLTIIVNTGDDFHHLGLTICPDVDTVLYTLAGLANPETGWGRRDESWRVLGEIGRLAGPDWFRLGDLDLATHLVRSQRLAEGHSLTAVTRHLGRHFGLGVDVLPMSDSPAPTMIDSDEGLLPFQTWFVARRWLPAVRQVLLPENLFATPQVTTALEEADIVVIAPSNPFVSIDPILNAYPVRAMVADLPQVVAAVSPIVAGQAIKGPAAKMMAELGYEVSAAAVADYYQDLIDIFVYDQQDHLRIDDPDRPVLQTNTIMADPASRARLAGEILNSCMELLNS